MASPFIDIGASGVVWDEEVGSDSGEVSAVNPRGERRWLVTGTYDIEDVLANEPGTNVPKVIVRGSVPLIFKSFKYEPTQPTLGNSWHVAANYEFQVESIELSFDTSGATTKRTQALDEGEYYSCQGALTGPVDPGELIAGGPAAIPDFKGVIPDGADVPDQKSEFTVTIRNRFSTLPTDYLDMLEELTGHTNDRPLTLAYKGQLKEYDQEELVYLGSPGKILGDDGFEISLKFAASRSTGVSPRGVDASPGSVTTADYTQPAASGLVTVTVASVTPFEIDDIVYVQTGGRYQVFAIGATTLGLTNLGDASNAAAAATVPSGSWVAFQSDTLSIGQSGPIRKLGWRFLKPIIREVTVGGQRVSQPQLVIVYKAIPTADLGRLGIFQ